MNKLLTVIGLTILIGCASQKAATTTTGARGDTRAKKVEYLSDDAYLLTETTDDRTYGYERSNPIKVGGVKGSSGPRNKRSYLNALLGPNGEQLKYSRAGSCCPFKTLNGFMDNTGMLDRYSVTWTGASDTLDIFINMYDEGDLKIPVGLTARKKN